MDSGNVEVKDGYLYYEVEGYGTPVVLIHAGYLDSRMWDEQFKLFSMEYKVIRYDVRGFGKSSCPGGKYSDSRDLKSLLDQLGIEKGILVGVSNGGRIALDFAVEHADQVRALVLMDFGVSGYESSGPEEDHLWDSLRDAEVKYQRLMMEGDYRDCAAIDVDLWTSMVSDEMRERLLMIATENARKSTLYVPDLQIFPDPPAFARLKDLQMPILMILGDHDVPGQIASVKRVHQLLPESELVTIQGADHIPSLSKPYEFNKILGDFLSSLGSGTTRTF